MTRTEINVLCDKLATLADACNVGCECEVCGETIVLDMPDGEDVAREAIALIRELTKDVT